MKVREESAYWGGLARDFNEDQTHIVGDAIQRDIIRWLSDQRELGKLLELGCGDGYYTTTIAGNADEVVATDLCEEMVVEARKRLDGLENVTVERADCAGTEYPPDTLDTVFMANLIHILEDPSSALEEGHRVLKSEGLLLVVDVTAYGMKRRHVLGVGMRFFRRWGKPLHHFRGDLSPDELRTLVEAAGFEVETVEVIGDKVKAIVMRARKR